MENAGRPEEVGKMLSTIFIACLAALFAYGFILPLITG